jgi:hypothetical protein
LRSGRQRDQPPLPPRQGGGAAQSTVEQRRTELRDSMFEITNENFARMLEGLTVAVGNRKNRILFYQFLAAEIRALHLSYGVGDRESYKRALTFLKQCERLTLRSLMRKSAERHFEMTIDHARRIFLRALEKLNASPARSADLEDVVWDRRQDA